MPVRPIRKVLVANRGEIAVRVMRTCRDLGIAAVAVYSPSDRASLHVRYATEAYPLRGPSERAGYLHVEQIVAIARRSGADALHPGYGFLSENPALPRACQQQGVTFIGPCAEVMETMSSKTQARHTMQQAGVPVVPGLQHAAGSEQEALSCARKIGFPVMLKAALGGGGKGMRKVDDQAAFSSAWQATRGEAKLSFGDDTVYVEKFLDKPRHIEVQVFGDTHGRVRAFPERECSVQRRHQKVLEESPSPFVTDELRSRMATVACQAAAAVGYVGAGTIEFLVDANRNFYFMEMNTRLQVEHPITEMVTGLDLVKLQIDIAQGARLDQLLPAKPLQARGWAMEARVCAEDPAQGFLPSPGPIHHVRQPGGPFVRTDTAVYAGWEITPDYDPLIAKVIAWGADRASTLAHLDRALAEFTIKGCKTNTMFLRQVLHFQDYRGGDYDTGIVQRLLNQSPVWQGHEHRKMALLGAAVLNFERERQSQARVSPTETSADGHNAWRSWVTAS
ncbi:MAG: biotin carboxylase N-terminal domain-containing protein [Myxococcota bacterium]